MRNYRKKNTKEKKQGAVQRGENPNMSVKQNKANLKSTVKGTMKQRGKPPKPTKPAGETAKPAAAKPAAADGSSTDASDNDKEDELIPEPPVAAKRAATLKPAAKQPAAKPGAIDTEDGSPAAKPGAIDTEEKAPAPAAKKQKVTKKAAEEDPTVDRSADSSSTDNRMYAYFQFTHNTVIL
jgi:hypothetical protein